MYHTGIGKIKNSRRAVILLGIYLLQFFCFQTLVVEFSGQHHLSVQKFFSPRHSERNNNATIAVFRTMEKHFSSRTETFSVKDISVIHTSFDVADLSLHPAPDTRTRPLLPGTLSDDSYRRYLRMRVLLI